MIQIPKKLIVLGDSHIYGWGDRENGGWCERLRTNWMGLPNAPVIYQLGVRGDGLEKLKKRWKSEWESRGEVRRKYPEGILLSIGLNDSAKVGGPDGRPQLSSEAYRYGLFQLIKEIKLHTNIMVIGLTAIDEKVMPFAECLWYTNKAIEIYESQIEETCLEQDIPFLPLYKNMICDPNWLKWIEPDGIHLNHLGHQWIYEKVSSWPALLKWAELSILNTPTNILI